MKITKEQLLTVRELKLSDKIDKMNENWLDEYCKILDMFIESFPAQESELKNFFKAKDHTSFTKALLTVRDVLTKIYADDLAKNCHKLLIDIKTAKYEIVEAYLTYLLTAISALSIDIQMAAHKDTNLNDTDMKDRHTATDGETEDQYKRSILAVDDVSLLLNGLKSALQNTVYKFTGVTSGPAALKFIKNHKPDLFILDIEMPEMNGYVLAEKIRESGHTAPIVFLTGNAKKEYVVKAIQAGAVDFIVKPIDKDQVLDKIRKYIG